MNNFTKCFLGLLGTTVLNSPSLLHADSLSSQLPANDTFLGKLGISPRAATTSDENYVKFTTETLQVNEGDGSAKIAVERSCSDKSLPVALLSYQITRSNNDDEAKQGIDYGEVYGTLKWNENECGIKEFQVPIIDDVEPEFNENFWVMAIDVQNTTLSVNTNGLEGTEIVIVDNDADRAAKTNVLNFTQQNYQLDEGKSTAYLVEREQCVPYSPAGTVDIIITSKEAEVGYKLYGSSVMAKGGNVFTLRWNEVSSRSDCNPLSVYMMGMQDTLIEPTETAELTLANPSPGTILGQSHSTIDILDDDSSTIGFAQMNYETKDSPFVDITVERKNCTRTTPAATVVFSGSGMYENLPTLTWQQNECGSRKVQLSADQQTYGNLFRISGATLGLDIVNALRTSEFSGTQIGFSQPTYNTLENSTGAIISVERTGCEKDIPAPAAEAHYSSYDITTTATYYTEYYSGDFVDYVGQSGDLSWEANECGVKSFTVPIIQDSAQETNESLSLNLYPTTGAMVNPSSSGATLTIIDDEPSPEDKFIAPKSTLLTLLLGTSDGLDLSSAKAPLTWKVSDEKIVKVDAAGNVTALALGEAIVTMTDVHDNVVSWQVNVVPKELAVLTFQGNQETSVGNYLDLKINSRYVIPDGNQKVDLWVGIHTADMPDDQLLYVTDSSYISNLLSATPQPFKRGLQQINNTYPLLHFVVTPDMVGEYKLYAMLTESGKKPFEDTAHRSILATQTLKIH